MEPRKEPYRCFCGPFWCPKFLRRFLSIRFNAACRLHDMHYSKKIGRREADKRFLKNMCKLSRNCWDKCMAIGYYIAVRVGGWISYR